MFLNFDSLLKRTNRELGLVGVPQTSRTVLYRLRSVYLTIYPCSQKLTPSGRLIYDEPVALFLYFVVRLHLHTGSSYPRTLIFMRGLEQQLQQRNQRFSTAFPSYSAINTYFANFAPNFAQTATA
jgi:hypothetical protein